MPPPVEDISVATDINGANNTPNIYVETRALSNQNSHTKTGLVVPYTIQ